MPVQAVIRKKAYSFLVKARQLYEEGNWDFDINKKRFISSNNKTLSFLDYCSIKDIDVEEIFGTILNDETSLIYNVGKNKRSNYVPLVVIKKRMDAVSDEALYCKMSIVEDVLYVVLHRDISDF